MKTVYVCQSCVHSTGRWVGRCITCDNWDTVVEEIVIRTETKNISVLISIKTLLDNVIVTTNRLLTGIEELDRVLVVVIVKGASILIGGEPGIRNLPLYLELHLALHNFPLSGVSMYPARNLWNK